MPNQNNDVVKPEPIKMSAIKAMERQLKVYTIEWARLLADKMYPQSEEDKKKKKPNTTGMQKVYNIASNQTKSNNHRVAFILKGNELLAELKKVQKKALAVADQILEDSVA